MLHSHVAKVVGGELPCDQTVLLSDPLVSYHYNVCLLFHLEGLHNNVSVVSSAR